MQIKISHFLQLFQMQKLKYNSIKAAQNVQYNFTKIVHTTKPCKAEEIFRSHILGGGGGGGGGVNYNNK